MTAKILAIDIERLDGLADGVYELRDRRGWIHPDRIVEPPRTICFAYQWIGQGKTKFVAEWDGKPQVQDNTVLAPGGGHRDMVIKAYQLFDEADYIVGWNSKTFDVRHLQTDFWAYGLGKPSPHVDIDLMKQLAGQLALLAKSMAYVSKVKGMDGKEHMAAQDWRKLRWSQGDVLRRTRRKVKSYNIRDVDQTVEIYYDSIGWLKGINVGLQADDAQLRCPNCGSDHLQSRGTAVGLSYKYGRYQCQDCGKWLRDTRSFGKTEVVGI